MSKFDAAAVRSRADEMVKADKTKVEDARQLFLEEIMDWTDYYSENKATCSEADLMEVFDSLVQLWILYAQFEISLNQFKKAVEVFEKATVDPICGKSLRLYEAYAKFCLDRKKPGNAQNVYIQALCAGLQPSENEMLWAEFLNLMHTANKSEKLTLEELYEAVRSQDGVDEDALAVPLSLVNQQHPHPSEAIDAVEAKEDDAQMEVTEDGKEGAVVTEASVPHTEGVSATTAPTSVTVGVTVPADAAPAAAAQADATGTPTKERRHAAPDDLDDVAGYTPEQLIRTFCARPPMLFTALHKEPTASGISALTADPSNPGAAELEAFLGVSLSHLPTVTPNMHAVPLDFTTWTPADTTLDLLEGMALAQALKERHFDSWISDLRNMHVEQEAALVESFLDTEGEACAGKSADERAAIKKRQHSELMIFRNHCAVQQELLHALINKSLFALLLEQQTQLAELGFPRFHVQFTESLRGYIQARRQQHSAAKADFDPALVRHVAAQRELVCAFLSVRLQTISTERTRAAQGTKTKLARAPSIDQDNDIGGDYFDAEAKKRRKRRRIILQHHNDSYSQSGVSSYGTMDSPGGGYAGAASPDSSVGYPNGGGGGVGSQVYTAPSYEYAQEQAAGNPALQVLQKLSALIKPRGRN